MKALRRLIVIIFLLILAPNIQAQVLSILEALDHGQKNYPLLKSHAAEVSSYTHEINVARSEYIPKLSLQHQYTYGTDNSVAGSFYANPVVLSPSGGIRTRNNYNSTWGSYTSALLEWNVFNFGRVASSIKSSKAGFESSKAAFENELFQHQIRVADAYLLALISGKLVTIQKANMERALRFKEIVDAGVRSGLRAGVDSSLAHAEYIKTKLLLLENESNKKSQIYKLIELTGEPADIITLDSMKFFTTLPLKLDSISNTNVNLQRIPLLRYYHSRVDVAQFKSVAVNRSFLPSVTLVGAAWARGSGIFNDDSFHTSFSDGTEYRVYNYLLGVSTRWIISDFVSTHQRYKSAQYIAIREEELYNEQSLKVQRQLKESDMQFQIALEQARTAPLQLSAAQQGYQQANARYKSGLADLPTLLQSMVSLSRAEADLAIAYSNVWRSLLSIAAAKGDLSIFLNSIQ